MDRTSKGRSERPAAIDSKDIGDFPEPNEAPSEADWISEGDIEPGDQVLMNPAESMTKTESVGPLGRELPTVPSSSSNGQDPFTSKEKSSKLYAFTSSPVAICANDAESPSIARSFSADSKSTICLFALGEPGVNNPITATSESSKRSDRDPAPESGSWERRMKFGAAPPSL